MSAHDMIPFTQSSYESDLWGCGDGGQKNVTFEEEAAMWGGREVGALGVF